MTGKIPPVALSRIINDPIVLLSTSLRGQFSEGLLHAIDQSLKFKPEQRPQSITAFQELLGLKQSCHAQKLKTSLQQQNASTGNFSVSKSGFSEIRQSLENLLLQFSRHKTGAMLCLISLAVLLITYTFFNQSWMTLVSAGSVLPEKQEFIIEIPLAENHYC